MRQQSRVFRSLFSISLVLLAVQVVGFQLAPQKSRLLAAAKYNSGRASAALSSSAWEEEDGVAFHETEELPTTIEAFLQKKFPEFYFLLTKNEEIFKSVQDNKEATFFAPSSKAFENLGAKRLQQLEDERNLETAQKIAAYHVVPDEAIRAERLRTEDWTKGRPKDGSKPALTVESMKTLGGVVPIGRSKSGGGLLGIGAKKDGDAIVGTGEARIVLSYFVGDCVVHEMDALISPELLWRYCDQLRIPGF